MELDLRRLAADLRDAGVGAAAIAQHVEAERVGEAEVLTPTSQKAEAQLDQVVQDPRALSAADLPQPTDLMASPRGLEPPTHSLGNCCSILLSYGDDDGEDTPAARSSPVRLKPV